MPGGSERWRAPFTFNGGQAILGTPRSPKETGPANLTGKRSEPVSRSPEMNVPDIERLRRELAEYVDVADESPEDLQGKALRGKRNLQELMNEVIRITRCLAI